MSEEEERRRSKRFLNKITRKSTENILRDDSSVTNISSGMTPTSVFGSTSLSVISPDRKDSVDSASSEETVTRLMRTSNDRDKGSGGGSASKVLKTPSKEGVRFRVSTKYSNSTRSMMSREEADEETDQLSMDDFNRMMDTLAQQPQRKGHVDSDDEDNATEYSARSFNNETIVAVLRNENNAIAAAFYSEKGSRATQEDRCILIPNLATMKLENHSFDAKSLEALSYITLACVFDGHNGSSCSQYLSRHFAASLVSHPSFLDRKKLDSVIVEVCKNIDRKLCKVLREDDDESGSTGVIAIYDGRKHIFTVAGVGDSMCVLSRGGRAVALNKMHRLDNEAEIERIKMAGGTVLNSRVNGILAVSRAFGDTEFKGEEVTGQVTGSLLIAEPEIYSEIITPMTEFAIIATDGLWDM